MAERVLGPHMEDGPPLRLEETSGPRYQEIREQRELQRQRLRESTQRVAAIASLMNRGMSVEEAEAEVDRR